MPWVIKSPNYSQHQLNLPRASYKKSRVEERQLFTDEHLLKSISQNFPHKPQQHTEKELIFGTDIYFWLGNLLSHLLHS